MQTNGEVKIVILAAGKGKRMQDERPKVLLSVKGKSMIERLLESVKLSGVDAEPTIVVGHGKKEIMHDLGTGYDYVIQSEQLGTGHAVLTALNHIGNNVKNILVLYGDNPLMTQLTIRQLVKKHLESGAKITMATVTLPDFEDWRKFFYNNFSRIIRDKNGNINRAVEFRDATEAERKIKEVNPCFFCFDTKWLSQKLKNLKNNNSQKEYYLTDVVKIAMEEGTKIESIKIEPREALAANSKEELEILERFAV